MPERSAVAVVVRLVGWRQLEERVCVQTSVNTRVVARLWYKYQMPDTWNSEGALEESEMDKAAAAVGLGSVPTTAQQRRVTSTIDKDVREGEREMSLWRIGGGLFGIAHYLGVCGHGGSGSCARRRSCEGR